MTTPELGDLVARAQRGDATAVEDVLMAVRDTVYQLTLRMTANRDDALDATQEILVKILTRLSTYNGEAAFTTWVHRVAVNHLLDRKRSAVERFELTFGAFADDLHTGLSPAAPDGQPELDLLAREVKHGCTLALLTCLNREDRVAYLLGEVFAVSSTDGAWICGTTEATFRKRLSRARADVRAFVTEHCGLVAPTRARCHCRRRVTAAVALGRVDPTVAEGATRSDVDAAVAEMEMLYDVAGLIRTVPGDAPEEVATRIHAVLASGRFPLLNPRPSPRP